MEISTSDCSFCAFLDKGCCKTCFREDEFNVFQSLSDEELDLIVSKKREVSFAAGETIVKQNAPSTYAVCIKKGIIKVNIEGVGGKKITIKLLSKHDFVTGGDVFNGNIQAYTLKAATDVVCCLIDSVQLTELFQKNTPFVLDMFRQHSRQNNYLLKKLVNLTQKYMPGRVANTLLYLKDDIFQANPFILPFTRQELAEMSNMTKESFIRILQEFKKSNILKAQGNTIEILDTKALEAINKNG